MAKASRSRMINELYKKIMALQGKCPAVNDASKNLVKQYAQFAVMSSELAQEIQNELGQVDEKDLLDKVGTYASLSKIAVSLYKTLKLDAVKDEVEEPNNPYLELMIKAAKDDHL